MGYCKTANLCIIIEIKEGLSGNFKVQVYDKENALIKESDLDCWAKERLYLDLNNTGEYIVKVSFINKSGTITPISASRLVNIYTNKCNVQYFIFDKTKPIKVRKLVKVNFKLTDKYYENLPIEKGVLILWPNI